MMYRVTPQPITFVTDIAVPTLHAMGLHWRS
jgi:hypothetical protein